MRRPLPTSLRRVGRPLLALLAGAALVGVMFHATHRWFGGGSFVYRSSLLPLLIWTPVLFLVRMHRQARRDDPPVTAPGDRDPALYVLLGALLLALVSNLTKHGWFYYFLWLHLPTETRVFGAGLERFALGVALLSPLLLVRRRLAGWLFLLLAYGQSLAFLKLMRFTGGLALYRDDHPSFLFRIHEFTRIFPAYEALNPWWNAGVINSVGASSGVAAIALPFFPLWRRFPVHEIYTPLLGVMLIVAMPLLAVGALRALRASWTAAAVAGILALGATRFAFVWALHFGTVGAAVAMSFLPPVAALTYRVLVLRRTDLATLAAWVVCTFFLFLWPPGLLMAATLGIGAVWNARRWGRRAWLRLAVAAAVLGLLMLPNILAIAGNGQLLAFVLHRPAAHPAAPHAALPPWPVWWNQLLATLGKRLVEAHPVITLLGVGGVLVLPLRRARRWFLPPVLLLLLIAAWGPLLLPKMQLERMAIPALLVAVIPAALWSGRLLRGAAPRLAIARAGLLALLLLGVTTVSQVYANKGFDNFNALPPDIERLAAWVRTHVPADGRLLFLGRNIHAFGHGHIAYLPILTDREMMACDYYAFPPGMVEYSYPPRPWRGSAEGIAAFMRLHGATHLITYDENRLSHVRAAPELFTEVPDLRADGYFVLALRDPAPGRCHAGRATVTAACGRLTVSDVDGEQVVLRYNWDARLRATRPAELFPVAVTNDVTFLGVRPRGLARVEIRCGGSP